MRKLHLLIAVLVAAAAVSIGAVVAFAHGSPQQSPASGKQAPSPTSAPTAAGNAGSAPAAPAKPAAPPANARTAAIP